ncbi:MAG: hypothetical protein WEB52_13575 [Dehalococcoidia bacterium]
MDEARRRLLAIEDEGLPALPAMLGDEAASMLDAAVTDGGGRVFSARPAQVTWRPGRSLAETYDARVGCGGKRSQPDSDRARHGVPARQRRAVTTRCTGVTEQPL